MADLLQGSRTRDMRALLAVVALTLVGTGMTGAGGDASTPVQATVSTSASAVESGRSLGRGVVERTYANGVVVTSATGTFGAVTTTTQAAEDGSSGVLAASIAVPDPSSSTRPVVALYSPAAGRDEGR